MIQNYRINCKESRIENTVRWPGAKDIGENNSFYGCFEIGPFESGQALTVANALRRTLLSEVTGLGIIAVQIENVYHEFGTLTGVRESTFDILLNLKEIVLKKTIKSHLKRSTSLFDTSMWFYPLLSRPVTNLLTTQFYANREAFTPFFPALRAGSGTNWEKVEPVKGCAKRIGNGMQHKVRSLSSDPFLVPKSKIPFFGRSKADALHDSRSEKGPEERKGSGESNWRTKCGYKVPFANNKIDLLNSYIDQSYLSPQIGYLKIRGPGIVRAKDLRLPPFIQCVNPEQYITTLTVDGFLNMRFIIIEGTLAETQLNGNPLHSWPIMDMLNGTTLYNSLNKKEAIVEAVFEKRQLCIDTINNSFKLNKHCSTNGKEKQSVVPFFNKTKILYLDPVFNPVIKVNYTISTHREAAPAPWNSTPPQTLRARGTEESPKAYNIKNYNNILYATYFIGFMVGSLIPSTSCSPFRFPLAPVLREARNLLSTQFPAEGWERVEPGKGIRFHSFPVPPFPFSFPEGIGTGAGVRVAKKKEGFAFPDPNLLSTQFPAEGWERVEPGKGPRAELSGKKVSLSQICAKRETVGPAQSARERDLAQDWGTVNTFPLRFVQGKGERDSKNLQSNKSNKSFYYRNSKTIQNRGVARGLRFAPSSFLLRPSCSHHYVKREAHGGTDKRVIFSNKKFNNIIKANILCWPKFGLNNKAKQKIKLEIWTNGSIHPSYALYKGFNKLTLLFSSLKQIKLLL
uniref:Plastid-encoded RNA polymerase subunit alpha n=1 Tax=Volvocales sp. NrCl902 TaxID=2682054 RepID=A0A7G1GG91_9CHLO|nr:RNA polymerase alpha subunit [Volvocales sp. NrCl902]